MKRTYDYETYKMLFEAKNDIKKANGSVNDEKEFVKEGESENIRKIIKEKTGVSVRFRQGDLYSYNGKDLIKKNAFNGKTTIDTLIRLVEKYKKTNTKAECCGKCGKAKSIKESYDRLMEASDVCTVEDLGDMMDDVMKENGIYVILAADQKSLIKDFEEALDDKDYDALELDASQKDAFDDFTEICDTFGDQETGLMIISNVDAAKEDLLNKLTELDFDFPVILTCKSDVDPLELGFSSDSIEIFNYEGGDLDSSEPDKEVEMESYTGRAYNESVASRFSRYRKMYEGADLINEKDDKDDEGSDDSDPFGLGAMNGDEDNNDDDSKDDSKDDDNNGDEDDSKDDDEVSLTAVIIKVDKDKADACKDELVEAGIPEDQITIIDGDNDDKDSDNDVAQVRVDADSIEKLAKYLDGKGIDLGKELGIEIPSDEDDKDKDGGDDAPDPDADADQGGDDDPNSFDLGGEDLWGSDGGDEGDK